MIREKAKELLNLLKEGRGSATIFGSSYYDDEIQQIIEIITNECKSTIIRKDGTTKRYESDIYIEIVKDIIQQLLSDKNTIKNSLVSRLTRIPQRDIAGIMTEVKVEKKLDKRGIPYIDIDKPIQDNFNTIINGSINEEELINKVIKPYIARLCKKEEKLSKRYFFSKIFSPLSGKEITDQELEKRFEQYLRKNTEITDISEDQIKNISKYFIYNILGSKSIIQEVINDEVEGKSLEVLGQKKKIGYSGMIQNMSNNLLDILNTIPNPNIGLEEVKDIYANLVGQLEALSVEPEKTPKVLEEQIKNINKSINRHTQEYYGDNGYRTVNVGFSGKDVGLLKKEYVPQAMKLYSESIIALLKRADEMKQEQYIKEVAKLHYRFIQIHPFPDGNGRTARAISNMLLLEKNLPAVFTKQNKPEYIRQMEGTRVLVKDYNYMEALHTDQSKCNEMEEKSIYKLEEYIGIKCLDKKEIYKDRQITEELPQISNTQIFEIEESR